MRKSWMRAGAMAAILVAAAALTPASSRAEETRWGPDSFPDVPLTTQDGAVVHFRDLLRDKVVAIDLIYTHCTFSCPLVTARLVQVHRLLGERMGKEIVFLSITLDPKRDTPEVLKAYAEKFHAGAGWLFLTGQKEDIDLISRRLGLLSYDPTPVNRDGHTPELMIGNPSKGQWMRNSAVDNAQFLATLIHGFVAGPKRAPAGQQSYAAARPIAVDKGQYLFTTRCAACHTIGHGDRVGPDLLGVTSRRDHAWLMRFVMTPDKLLADGDPIAKALYARYQVNMPNLRMGQEDVAELIGYLKRQSAAPAPSSGSAAVRSASLGSGDTPARR
jgi:protein SCO1/2